MFARFLWSCHPPVSSPHRFSEGQDQSYEEELEQLRRERDASLQQENAIRFDLWAFQRDAEAKKLDYRMKARTACQALAVSEGECRSLESRLRSIIAGRRKDREQLRILEAKLQSSQGVSGNRSQLAPGVARESDTSREPIIAEVSEVTALKRANADFESRILRQDAIRQQLNDSLVETNKKASSHAEELLGVKKSLEIVTSRGKVLEMQNQGLNNALTTANAELSQLHQERSQYASNLETLQRTCFQLQAQGHQIVPDSQASATIEQKNAQIHALESRVQTLTQEGSRIIIELRQQLESKTAAIERHEKAKTAGDDAKQAELDLAKTKWAEEQSAVLRKKDEEITALKQTKDVPTCDHEHGVCIHDNSMLEEQVAKLRQDVSAHKNAAETLRNNVQMQVQELERLKQQLERTQAHHQAEVANLKREGTNLLMENERLAKGIEACKHENDVLKNRHAAAVAPEAIMSEGLEQQGAQVDPSATPASQAAMQPADDVMGPNRDMFASKAQRPPQTGSGSAWNRRDKAPSREARRSARQSELQDKLAHQSARPTGIRKSWRKSSSTSQAMPAFEASVQSAEDAKVFKFLKPIRDSGLDDIFGGFSMGDDADENATQDNKSVLQTANAENERMEVHDDDNKKSAHSRHRPNNAASGGNSFAQEDRVARAAFDEAFPRGYDTIWTPGTGLQCGLEAVVRSMEAMYPNMPRPSVQNLQAILDSPDFQAFVQEFQVDDQDGFSRNNFSVDEIGAVLNHWASSRGLMLRIGYVVDSQPPRPYWTPTGTRVPLSSGYTTTTPKLSSP